MTEPSSDSDRGDADRRDAAVAHELNELFFGADAEERRLMLHALGNSFWTPATMLSTGDTIARLEIAALSHNTNGFVIELQRALSIPAEIARRVVDDPSGEPLVVVALALGMGAEVLQRILLCLSAEIAQSIELVYRLADLQQEIEPEAASRLVAIWQALPRADLRPKPAPSRAHERIISAERPVLSARKPIAWDQHVAKSVG